MKIKRKYAILLIILLVILCGAVYYLWRESQFKLYENPTYGIQIKYPRNWTMADADLEEGGVVSFLSPLESELDIFQENVNITIQRLTGRRMILQEYVALAVRQLQTVFKDIALETSESAFVAEQMGHKLIYKIEVTYLFKIMHIWAMQRNNVYTITYTAEVDKFERYLKIVDPMVKSFKIK